ncbi:MAG: VCBS repeat-containing protein [Burkholderiales bacterium]|nr:VCBS repeat-containing protein [Burkholderiales bacterium]
MAQIFRVLERAILLFALTGSAAGAETILDARYTAPVERYGHFALGRPHEYARLSANTSSGRILTLDLPEHDVFEDLAPRLVKLTASGPSHLLAIISRIDSGARLALIGLGGDGLEIAAQSAPIGTPKRWLNPVGVADLDGDGRAEIAAVITPHIGGMLKVYGRKGAELVELAALEGFSNHVYGTTELALSTPLSIEGRMRLLVPDATRRKLRVIALKNGVLVETGRCALSAAITGPIKVYASNRVSVGLASGAQFMLPGACLR